jgi:hypothetical protein
MVRAEVVLWSYGVKEFIGLFIMVSFVFYLLSFQFKLFRFEI